MSNYVSPYSLEMFGRSGRDKVAYRDYLQAKSHVDDVRYSISESSREIIANAEQLHERGYELVASAIGKLGQEVTQELSEGFEEVSWKLDELSEGIEALNAKFDWGFSQMIAGIGRVNDSLKELIAVAKTPAETWAYEQYEIARDAIRRELYPEAVEALQRAINGHGDHVGYKLEYRFHYTLGILYLGDVRNTNPAVLDLAKAEASFLTAARYARKDYPAEACASLTAAGWAAYCQAKLPEAENSTRQALEIPKETHPNHGEAYYQLAKTQMHTHRPKEAIPNLRRAIDLDPEYSIKAATDLDFLKYESDVRALLEELRHATKEIAMQAISQAKQEQAKLKDWGVEGAFPDEWFSLREKLLQANRNYDTATFFGFLDAHLGATALTLASKDLLARQRAMLKDSLRCFSTEFAAMRDRIKSRAEACGSRSYRKVVEVLASPEVANHAEVSDHADFIKRKALFKEALCLLHESNEECRKMVVHRSSGPEAINLLIGVLALAFFISWILVFSDGYSPGVAGKITFCLIGGVIALAIFRAECAKRLTIFLGQVGIEPSFPEFAEIEAKCLPKQEKLRAKADDGHLALSLDEQPRAGALASGCVTFSNGQESLWHLDTIGKLEIQPPPKSEDDMKEFKAALEFEMAQRYQ